MIPIFQILQYVNALKQNPNQMSQFLLQQGRINKTQYDEIQQMGIGGNPEAIGQYLMNRGMMNRQQVQEAYETQAVPINNSMTQN